jgi:hypothetical protein
VFMNCCCTSRSYSKLPLDTGGRRESVGDVRYHVSLNVGVMSAGVGHSKSVGDDRGRLCTVRFSQSPQTSKLRANKSAQAKGRHVVLVYDKLRVRVGGSQGMRMCDFCFQGELASRI